MSSDGLVTHAGTPPTLDDIARLAGVSRATASRAISGTGAVSSRSAKAVSEAVQQLSYVPNQAARSLATRRSGAIGVIVAEPGERVFADPFIAQVIAGVADGLREASQQMVMLMRNADEGIDRLSEYVRSGHVDGLIVVSHHRDDLSTIARMAAEVPVMLVGRPTDMSYDVPYVDIDNYQGGRIVAEHLLARGCKHLGTVAGPQDMEAGASRLQGWRDLLQEAGLNADAVVTADFTIPGGLEAMQQLHDAHPDLDGVFIASDLMALGAMRALYERGLLIPDDIRMVGFDASGVAGAPREGLPRLTSVTNPARKMASLAAAKVLESLSTQQRPTSEVLDVELVVGESSQ